MNSTSLPQRHTKPEVVLKKRFGKPAFILAEEESKLHKQARYLFIQLAIRSNNPNLMKEAKDTLDLMSSESGIAGLEAIRFYFGISGYTTTEAMTILQKTFQHPSATLSDKLEAATLCHNAAPERTSEITATLETTIRSLWSRSLKNFISSAVGLDASTNGTCLNLISDLNTPYSLPNYSPCASTPWPTSVNGNASHRKQQIKTHRYQATSAWSSVQGPSLS